MQTSLLTHNPMIYKGKNGFEYPEFYEIYEKACASTWTHHEVSMDADLRDWQFNTTPTERTIIAGVLRGFVASELGIGDYWSDDVCKLSPKPEIHAMARAFSFFETIHAAAYSYLNDVLGLNEYEEFIQDPIAVSKIETFFKTYPPKVNLAVFSGAGEGVSLFSSFAILLSFNRDGRFKGLAQIISWSSIDENCVHGDTEILTPKGWKKISEYAEGEEIAQYDPETQEISFVTPSKFIKNKTTQLIEISKNQRFYQRVTPEHTIVDFKAKTFEVRKSLAKDWSMRQGYMPLSGFTPNSRQISPLDRFAIALQADGCIRKTPSLREVGFSFKKPRKIKRMRALLEELKSYGFSSRERQSKDYTVFSVLVPNEYLKYRSKHFHEIYNLNEVPAGFLEELVHWDGHQQKNSDAIYYSSKVKENVEFVQTVASLQGYYGHIITRWNKLCTQYRINLKKSQRVPTRRGSKKVINLDTPIDVFCFKVPTQAFLIRDNGLISVTGNCHANGGIKLFNALVEEVGITPEEIQQIYEGFKLVVDNEFAFIDNVFNKVNIPTISQDSLKSYILSRANAQLQDLGLEPIFEMTQTQIQLARELAEWFEPMAFGLSSNDFFAQSKDGSNYISKVSQDFDGYDINTLDLSELEYV